METFVVICIFVRINKDKDKTIIDLKGSGITHVSPYKILILVSQSYPNFKFELTNLFEEVRLEPLKKCYNILDQTDSSNIGVKRIFIKVIS